MATDENQIYFTTQDFNYQKVAMKAEATDTITDATYPTPVAVTITHNLGYIPSARAWYRTSGASGRRYPINDQQYVGHLDLFTVSMYLTTTTMVLLFRNASGSPKDVRYWYRIYRDV